MQGVTDLLKKHAALAGAAVIALLFLVTVIAINPLHNYPVEDDWDYSRSVRILYESGRLVRSEYAQATVIVPTLYGGLVSKVFGFSFITLRFTTLVLALGALLAFYALLGELNFDVPRRLLGTLALLCTPVFIYLAFSFMTDVPALCWMMLSVLFYVRALKRGRAHDTFLGAAFAGLAFLTRQTGVFVPLAFGAVVLVRLPRAAWLRSLVYGVLPFATVLAAYLVLSSDNATNWANQNITFGLTLKQMLQPEWWGIFLRRAVQSLMTVSLYLTPLLVAVLFGVRRSNLRLPPWTRANAMRALGIAVATVLVAITVARLAARGEWFPYLTDILTRAGMRPYLAFIAWNAHALRPDLLPLWTYVALTCASAVLGIVLVGMLVSRVSRTEIKGMSPETQFLWVWMLLIALASFVFATFYERYLLPLVIGATLVLLETSRRIGFSWRAGTVGLAVAAVAIWFLMQDYWGWNDLRWQIGRELLAHNVQSHRIDAGYEWDGWYMYDATVEYIRRTGKPFIYDPWQYVLDPEYAMAFQPMMGYRIERVVPFPTLFSSNQFYLLHRQ